MLRRTFLQAAGSLIIVPLSACGGSSGNSSNGNDTPASGGGGAGPTTQTFAMPDESGLHTATWMAYGATANAWGTTGIYGASRAIARKDLMRIAANLSRFEPVKMLVANQSDLTQASQFLDQVKAEATPAYGGPATLPAIESAGAIQFILQALDDLWMRDTGPIFVRDNQHGLFGVNLNFNGWGQDDTGAAGWAKDLQKAANGIADQPIANDMLVADFVLKQAGASKISTWLVMEGGGIEVNGKGTAICTESCILNPNRNPGRTKSDVEAELLRLLGVRKVIWLPGVKAKDITDGHVDFYARFAGDSTVLFALDSDPQSPDYAPTQANQKILSSATDALGNKITAIPLSSPDYNQVKSSVEARNGWNTGQSFFNTNGFAAGYVGFYITNSSVLMAKFGDAAADQAAFNAIRSVFPTRTVIQITTDGIANGGGTIHCSTQQQI